MLTPEQITEQLEKAKSKKFVSERVARLAGVPEAVRDDARVLFDRASIKSNDWQKVRDRQEKARAAIAALSPKAQEDLIRTMVPELAPYAIRAMNNTARLPYHGEDDGTRKPFRGASMKTLMQNARAVFINELAEELADHPPDIEWIAAWAGEVWPYGGRFAGLLLAAAIDIGDEKGKKVLEILLAGGRGEHEVCRVSHQLIRALLTSENKQGWEFIEKFLLAAQREEGLRQVIFELIDECHPEVFPRFVRLALEHNMVRFSAVIRAVDVWFGFLWDAMSTSKAKKILETALKFFDDPAAGDAAIAAAIKLPGRDLKKKGKKLEEADEAVEPAYIALWVKAFVDVADAIEPAAKMASAANAEVRFVATHFLCQTELEDKVTQVIADRLDDEDERVAARALARFPGDSYYEDKDRTGVADLFERLENVFGRAPEKEIKLAPIVWPWMNFAWSKKAVSTALLFAQGARPATRLLPHLALFSADARYQAANRLAESKKWDAETRKTLFALVGDTSESVRTQALAGLAKCKIEVSEAQGLEALLTRKSAELRQGILKLLLSQPDAAVLASADRLTASKETLQRLAGLEMLRLLSEAKRLEEDCLARAEAYKAGREEMSADERTQINAMLQKPEAAITFDNCLGLIDVSKRTPPRKPGKIDVKYTTPATIALLKGIDALIHANREKPFTPVNRHGDSHQEELVGNATWNFPMPEHGENDVKNFPLKEIWMPWYENRPAEMRDADGLEIARAMVWMKLKFLERGYGEKPKGWLEDMKKEMLGEDCKLKYQPMAYRLVLWFALLYPAKGAAAFYLDGFENALAIIPAEKVGELVKEQWGDDKELPWREHSSPINELSSLATEKLTDEKEIARAFGLLRWVDEPVPGVPRDHCDLAVVLAAWNSKHATDEDVYDNFIGPRADMRYGSRVGGYCSLKPSKEQEKYPALGKILDRIKARVLDIELTRGETPTLVSSTTRTIKHTGGLDVLVRFLVAAERDTFKRGYAWSDAKPVVFSHVIRSTHPADGDTRAEFSRRVKEAKVSDERLIELAVFAPQWVEHVADSLKWPELLEAVWWIHAHTRDRSWSVDQEMRERWRAQVAQRTPLDSEDLTDGAVDVAWFARVYEANGKKRWEQVYDAAKFAASGGGHKRAQLYADAMLGLEKSKELIERIKSKRNQDAVRALGLLPLPKDAEKAKKEMLARYKVVQEFIRTARQFGSQRQASEKRAAAIGMENLARTAGYPDPIRLQWSMEAQSCADLAKGAVKVKDGEVEVSLSLEADGSPLLVCTKKGKELASIPPAVKKNPKVQELSERKTDLKRSSSRIRVSLEQAMVRGDIFAGSELAELMANPLVAPQLERLVFAGEGIFGYPVKGGKGLSDHAGKIEPVKKNEKLRLAHSHDLMKTGKWTQWQRDCFARERVQPFKQVFRELYVTTKTELDAKHISRRYAGHQVQPRQALALLGSRGWITAPEEGVFKTFHDLKITVWLWFMQAFHTPAEIEGLTLEGVLFTARSRQDGVIPLSEIPPRIFSEVMRDLDLVVSVAHRGGVDPEASASTVQMRSTLLGETMELLQIKNVRIKDAHAFIKGTLAEYSIHLGSAVTHRQPGGALFIVPVHSQHRGRIFLPFADDDPKTAEVISKVILLARDSEIKDPNLLSQLRS